MDLRLPMTDDELFWAYAREQDDPSDTERVLKGWEELAEGLGREQAMDDTVFLLNYQGVSPFNTADALSIREGQVSDILRNVMRHGPITHQIFCTSPTRRIADTGAAAFRRGYQECLLEVQSPVKKAGLRVNWISNYYLKVWGMAEDLWKELDLKDYSFDRMKKLYGHEHYCFLKERANEQRI